MEKENGLSYGKALEAVKEGKLITRETWLDEGSFVFMRPADELSINFIVHTVKSLPNSVKGYFAELTGSGLDGEDKIKFSPYLCKKEADESIANGWTPSQDDMLSNDWFILQYQ